MDLFCVYVLCFSRLHPVKEILLYDFRIVLGTQVVRVG